MTVQNQLKYAGAILTSVYDFTPTELNHLFTSPVQLIPPPGPNQAIVVLNVYTQLTFLTTAYTFDVPQFFYTGNQTDPAFPGGLTGVMIQGSVSSIISEGVSLSARATQIVANAGLMYGDFSSDSSTPGDSKVRMTIMYRVITLA